VSSECGWTSGHRKSKYTHVYTGTVSQAWL